MAASTSHHRFETVSRPLLCHRQHHDVHAGIYSAGDHAAASTVLANDARLHGARGGLFPDAGRIRDSPVHAFSGISFVSIRSAVADGLWSLGPFVRVVLYDPFRSGD